MATERDHPPRHLGRVSGDDQETASQVAELRSWAKRRDLEVVGEYVLGGASAWTGKQRGQLC